MSGKAASAFVAHGEFKPIPAIDATNQAVLPGLFHVWRLLKRSEQLAERRGRYWLVGNTHGSLKTVLGGHKSA